jgi:dihydroorotase
MSRYLLTNAFLVTGTYAKPGALAVDGERIAGIWLRPETETDDARAKAEFPDARIFDLDGMMLLAGGIDLHTHFREPGMTEKGDLFTESHAALLGGITSIFDMPNNKPPTVTLEALEDKQVRAEGRSWVNYSFHLGATNDNVGLIRELLALNGGADFGGIKVFMGSSTGNMLVDRNTALRDLFRIREKVILIHSEDEGIIKANLAEAKARWGEEVPFPAHPLIRSREACIRSTKKALEMALEYGTRLHILHVTTEEEIEMIAAAKRRHPGITAETSANYLWFSDADYDKFGGKIKCNPAIKSAADRAALRRGLSDGTLDTLGSDHAPHLLTEKQRPYLSCPSGIPSIQHSLPVLMSVAEGWNASGREDAPVIPPQRIASAISEKAAELLGIEERGSLQVGNFADLVVIDPRSVEQVSSVVGKCEWSPYMGATLRAKIKMVFLNGKLAVRDGKALEEAPSGQRLRLSKE